MKILVISLAGIGDTLFATPLLHELRLNFPDATIDVLARWAGSRQILEGNPHINEVYQADLAQMSTGERMRFLGPLRKNRYDVSINTHPQSRREYRLVARCVGARKRLSHIYECSGLLDKFLVNQTVWQNYTKHCAENNFALMELLGAQPQLAEPRYELFLSEAEEQWASAYLAQHGLAGRKLLGIHVGSGGTKNLPLRRWPAGHYADLISQVIRSRPDASVLLFGGPEETAAHEEIFRQIQSPQVLQPRTENIRQAAVLVKHCRAFLSVDTVFMHLAAAVGVPRQVVIETPTFNPTVEPYGQPYKLVKNPGVGGRNFQFYRYDGKDIQGTAEQLRQIMESVTMASVYVAVNKALD